MLVCAFVILRGWPGLRSTAAPAAARGAAAERVAEPAPQSVVLGTAARPKRRGTAQRVRPVTRGHAAVPAARPPARPRRTRQQSPAPPAPAPSATPPPAEAVAPLERATDLVQAPASPPDRGGLAGAADDIVGALDKLVP